jgi:hypothetical protein
MWIFFRVEFEEVLSFCLFEQMTESDLEWQLEVPVLTSADEIRESLKSLVFKNKHTEILDTLSDSDVSQRYHYIIENWNVPYAFSYDKGEVDAKCMPCYVCKKQLWAGCLRSKSYYHFWYDSWIQNGQACVTCENCSKLCGCSTPVNNAKQAVCEICREKRCKECSLEGGRCDVCRRVLRMGQLVLKLLESDLAWEDFRQQLKQGTESTP